ncbi:MAG: hypothetical protein ABIK67_00305, partial [candidate division WOR-3 bacterium]
YSNFTHSSINRKTISIGLKIKSAIILLSQIRRYAVVNLCPKRIGYPLRVDYLFLYQLPTFGIL